MKIEKTKLFKVLKRLSKREKEQLKLFLASPFFNKRKDVICLLEQLMLPRKRAIVAEKLFENMYPAHAFNEQNLRLVLSYLFRLVEHFLIYQQLFKEDKKVDHKRAAIHAYQDLQLPALAEKSLRTYQKHLEENSLRHADYYFQEFELYSERYVFSLIEQPFERQPFEEMSGALDMAYISFKLRQVCHALSNQSAYQHQYKLNRIPEIIHYVEAEGLQNTVAIGLYYYIYLTLTLKKPQAAFQQLKELLPQIDHSFPHKERRDIYLMLINHYIRELNKAGNRQAVQEISLLYKEGLRSGSLLEKGILSRFTYSNIIRIALKGQELDWAEDFIQKQQYKLRKEIRLNFFSLNMALLTYTRKEYDLALLHLKEIKRIEVSFELIARTLRLKIYVEQDASDNLDTYLNTMQKFIYSRMDINERHKKNYINIIRYTKRLYFLNPFDKNERLALIKMIEEEEILSEKNWLLTRLGIVQK